MKKQRMKKFFGEFKTFIMRGNVLDMAVGVIVGGAFTAIVNAVSNNLLRPIINRLLVLCLGSESLADIYTVLHGVYDETGALIPEQSIYIDWGALINAVINFLIIAFVLFCIVKAINNMTALSRTEAQERKLVRRYRKEGMSRAEALKRIKGDAAAEEAKRAEEAKKAAEEAEKARKAEEEKALANTRLLEEIRDLLKKNA